VSISSSNVERFLRGVATRKQSSSTEHLHRVEFVHRGRRYVAVRFRGGRVELYRVERDGSTETFVRYATRRLGGVDEAAVEVIEDRLDPAAMLARDLLAERYPPHVARNVRMGPACGEWGSVLCDYTDPHTGRDSPFPLYASIRLYSRIS
jgi:hypothetical protein